jgi:tRNA-Thr(GGU) m(6)t(6)A37 methyltransferase TsaA
MEGGGSVKPAKKRPLRLQPIGVIEASGGAAALKVFPAYREGLDGVQGFSHIWVLYWFHENDHSEGRSVLKVHPRKDPANPLTGVFGTRSPMRPNLVALSLCKIREIRPEEGTIFVESLDAKPGSPLIDIKPYLPHGDRPARFRLPAWARAPQKGKAKGERAKAKG